MTLKTSTITDVKSPPPKAFLVLAPTRVITSNTKTLIPRYRKDASEVNQRCTAAVCLVHAPSCTDGGLAVLYSPCFAIFTAAVTIQY